MRQRDFCYFRFAKHFALSLIGGMLITFSTVALADAASSQPVFPAFVFQDLRNSSASAYRVVGADTGEHLPDNCISPTAAEYFRLWLLNTFSDKWSGSVVVLKQLDIEKADAPVEMGAVRYEPMLGVLGSLIGRAVEVGITNARGRYLVTVQLSGTVDNENFSGSAEGVFRGKVTEENIKAVLDAAAGKAYIAINAALFVKNMRQQDAQAAALAAELTPPYIGP